MIDLFSDTHTLPDAGMRRAMAEAEVGDAQLGEDPTTRRLEEAVADMLGMERAMYMPTGSMCNKVAVSALTRPGDAVVCDHRAHVYRFEGGGSAVLSGIVFEPIRTDRGIFTPEQLSAVMNTGNVYQPRTSLVSIEQTHNFGGGSVWTIDEYEAACAEARRHGASIYTDGARLLNAVVATGVPADRWAAPVDAVWIDFSKGVGAPGGAAIAGSAGFIEVARRFTYMYGGALRQSGILAAAALYGLEHNVPRMADDQANARRLADGLTELGIGVAEPESNMVFCSPPDTGLIGPDGSRAWGPDPGGALGWFIESMADQGVRVGAVAGRIRMVTHVGVTAADVEAVIQAAARVLGSA
jgi:threonine aldolase